MAEWSVCQTRNLVLLGSSPALATCRICSCLFRVEILSQACKEPTGCLLPVGAFNPQRAKKVVSDSPGLVDFAIGLVIFVLNLPDGQVLCFWEIQITEGW